jgi:hypothetical protein
MEIRVKIFLNYKDITIYAMCIPCYHSMVHHQDADEDSVQLWMVAANILNKKSRPAAKGCSSSTVVRRKANSSP